LLFKGLFNEELEDLDLQGENAEILGCQKEADKIVSNLSCACFSVFDLLQSFASISFLFHLVLHMSSVMLLFSIFLSVLN